MKPPVDELGDATREWLAELGFNAGEETAWLEALTHGSVQGAQIGSRLRDYQRLEFLGDRVLGLTVAQYLFEAGNAAEGKLSQRLNALVSGATCARIARKSGVSDHVRLGKQAREDGGAESDNILGDVIEALLGASFVVHGFEPTKSVILDLWADELTGKNGESKHPKSALQEWAARHRKRSPEYEIIERSGPDHAMRFTVKVAIHNVGEATATANSKSAAERRAAAAFLEQFA